MLLENAHPAAPGDERGVVLYVRDDIEELFAAIGKHRLLRVPRHGCLSFASLLAPHIRTLTLRPRTTWSVFSFSERPPGWWMYCTLGRRLAHGVMCSP